VPTGVKELLRFTSPAQMTSRTATCDTVIGGVTIRENDPVIALIAAANRDPDVFENAGELVLDRTPNPHLSFGHGPHRCVGTKPAEEFLSQYLVRLAAWDERIRLAGPVNWLDTATLRCIDRLPCALS
jgi:cytochrome P450